MPGMINREKESRLRCDFPRVGRELQSYKIPSVVMADRTFLGYTFSTVNIAAL